MTDLTDADVLTYLGFSDTDVSCERCARSDIKHTVVVRWKSSDMTGYFGATCLSNALAEQGIIVSAAQITTRATTAQLAHEAQMRRIDLARTRLSEMNLPANASATRHEVEMAFAASRFETPRVPFAAYRSDCAVLSEHGIAAR